MILITKVVKAIISIAIPMMTIAESLFVLITPGLTDMSANDFISRDVEPSKHRQS